jgi:hypothetical protein
MRGVLGAYQRLAPGDRAVSLVLGLKLDGSAGLHLCMGQNSVFDCQLFSLLAFLFPAISIDYFLVRIRRYLLWVLIDWFWLRGFSGSLPVLPCCRHAISCRKPTRIMMLLRSGHSGSARYPADLTAAHSCCYCDSYNLTMRSCGKTHMYTVDAFESCESRMRNPSFWSYEKQVLIATAIGFSLD